MLIMFLLMCFLLIAIMLRQKTDKSISIFLSMDLSMSNKVPELASCTDIKKLCVKMSKQRLMVETPFIGINLCKFSIDYILLQHSFDRL